MITNYARLVLFVLLMMNMSNSSKASAEDAQTTPPKAPVAKMVEKQLTIHGHTRVDPYYWMKDRENPEVVKYLEAENAYLKAMTAPIEPFVEQLAKETKARIKQTDMSVPYTLRGYEYYSRDEDGKQYSIHCRKVAKEGAIEEVLLDVNKLAEGHKYCSVAGRKISSNNQLMAYCIDTKGRRIYTLRIKNLETGKLLADEVPNITGNIAWAEDNQTLFYTKQDPKTLRSYQIYRHTLGAPAADDVLVYEEKDETFQCFVYKTKSRRFMIIGSSQTVSNEYRYVDAKNPTGEFTIILPRERNHEYGGDHFGEYFYINTNDSAKNFRLVRAPIATPGKEHWEEIVPHREDVLLSGFELFNDYLIVQERRDGLTRIRILKHNGELIRELDLGESAYLAWVSTNPEMDSTQLRYGYTSMTTPSSVYDYDLVTGEKKLLKQREVLGGFDPANYVTERLSATARDGTKVPVSVVYRKDTPREGTAPCLLYSYGSYGSSTDPTFSSARLNLLDRGFVYAIAHIRGGQELGRQWYDNGKLLNKKNTFTDFIDVGEFLIEQKYADKNRLYASGGSAGGLLMGAIVNMRPEMFHGIIANVPFVDVITTMLDDTIPLTTGEYDEWGNPNEKEYYDYILSYSPYDNVEAKAYPNMLVTTGLEDSQVQYWEPAKWVAKLRSKKTDNNMLLLKTNMGAGHGGASGRYDRYKEIALRHAFFLHLAGKTE